MNGCIKMIMNELNTNIMGGGVSLCGPWSGSTAESASDETTNLER